MLVSDGNKFYHISFVQSHSSGLTQCFFTPRPDGAKFVGEARCSLCELFDNRKGKKIALLRAMKDAAKLDKTTRRAVWLEYLYLTKDPCLQPILASGLV